MSKEEDMQRTLCAEFSYVTLEYDGKDIVPTFGDWTHVGGNTSYTQQDIDLSGYAMEKKTFYPYSSFEQRANTEYIRSSATLTAQPYLVEVTIVSSVPLSDNDLFVSLVGAPGFISIAPGFNRFDRSVIIHGELRTYTLDSTMSVAGGLNALRLLDRQTFSSLEPTAADKLYCYRVITVEASAGEVTNVALPSSRILIPGTIASEPKLEYMMRLKRSYELANQV